MRWPWPWYAGPDPPETGLVVDGLVMYVAAQPEDVVEWLNEERLLYDSTEGYVPLVRAFPLAGYWGSSSSRRSVSVHPLHVGAVVYDRPDGA